MPANRKHHRVHIEVPAFPPPQFPDRHFLITDFGAVGNGITSNTTAFAEAIDACATAGGGTVSVPAGVWLTGPIEMKSNVRLHVQEGAVLSFSRRFEDYPLIHSYYEGMKAVRCLSPIYGQNLHNIAITGGGIIDGSGDAWRNVKRMKMTDSQWRALIESGGVVDEHGSWWPTKGALAGHERVPQLQAAGITDLSAYEPYRVFLRPVLLSLTNCRHILLDGPTFQNSPSWCLHPRLCEYVTIRNIQVRNPWHAQNGDGLDLDSCRYVRVEQSTFDVGDDGICLKSGKNEQGRSLGKPTAFVSIRQCTVFNGHGGFVIGSEMSGGVHDIEVADCTFVGTDVGLRFKSTRGRGGVVENIAIRNIYMKDIARQAILFDLYYEGKNEAKKVQDAPRPVSEETPRFHTISMDHIVCAGAGEGASMTGLPEMPVEHVSCRGLAIQANAGFSAANVRDWLIEDSVFVTDHGPLMSFYNCERIEIVDPERRMEEDGCLQVNGTLTKDISYNRQSVSAKLRS